MIFQLSSMFSQPSCIVIAIAVTALQILPGTSERTVTVTSAPEAIAHWVSDAIKAEAVKAAGSPSSTYDEITKAAAKMANKLATAPGPAPGPAPAPAPGPAPAPASTTAQPTTTAAPAPAPAPVPVPYVPSPAVSGPVGLGPAPAPNCAPGPAPGPGCAPGPAPGPGPGPGPGLPHAPDDFVVPTLRPGHGLSIPEMVQMAVTLAVDSAAKQAVTIAIEEARKVGSSAGHRLGNVLARTSAEAATKATSQELIMKACRVASVDGMHAVHEAAKNLGLTEDAVMVARQEVAVGGFQRRCENRVKTLTPVEWAEHHALHAAELQTRAFIIDEGSRRAMAAGEKAALAAVGQTTDSLKVRLGRLAAWQTEHELKATEEVATKKIREVAAQKTLKVALETASKYPKVMFQQELMNITAKVAPQLVAMIDKVAMKAVQDTVEETAEKTIVPATKRIASQVIQNGAQRQIFDQAMGVVAGHAHTQALTAAEAAAQGLARNLTNPQAFDILQHAGLGGPE